MFIKVCGLTTEEHIDAAADMGFSAAGIVLHEKSPRYCAPDRALRLAEYARGRLTTVAVALKREELAPVENAFDLIQLYEYFDSARLIAAGEVPPGEGSIYRYFMHDRSRGQGMVEVFPFYSEKIRERLIISGGLDPDNVALMMRVTKPAGVDVSSGVEKKRGVKDLKLMERFMQEVNHAYC